MLPKRIHISNYKCFPSESGGATIELRPLTLFYGYNNSGKSALLRGIALLVETLLQERFAMPIFLESKLLQGADFGSLLTVDKSSMDFSIDMDNGSRFDFSLRSFPDYFTHGIESFSILDADGNIETNAVLNLEDSKLTENKFVYTINKHDKYQRETKQIMFVGLNPLISTSDKAGYQLWSPLSAHWNPLSGAKQSVVWLSSERASAERQMPEKSGPIIISENGSGVEQMLHRAIFARLPWLDSLQEWFGKTFGLQIFAKSNSNNIAIEVGAKVSPHRVNILDAGQGIQEVLPIVTMLYSRKSNGDPNLLAIEEPESHLHPRYHAELAKAFCDAVKINPECVTLAETHSENLLLRIQIEIALGNILPDQVIVYWFRQENAGMTVVEPVKFDKLGRPTGGWPRGVFSEDIAQSRELFAIQSKLTNEG